MIRGIIGNPVYLGHTIMCKHETVFKVELLKKTPDADRIRVDNTHEPLVSQEIFDNANAKILSRKREDTSGNVSIFYDDLYDAVLADIQYHAQLAYEDRDKAVALAIRMNDKAEGSRAKSSEGKLKQARKRYDEVTRMFDRLYEDSLSGRISNDNFTRLVDKYQAEQAQLLEQIDALERAMQEVRDTRQNAVQWADLMAGYAGIQELTAENLNLLVERIEVFDRAATDDGVEQTIRICYRFGGYIGERCFKVKAMKHGGHRRKGVNNEKALLVS